MTDNEIIKALERCGNIVDSSCKECAYHDTYNASCVVGLMRDALDLINRQKAKVAVLSMKNAELDIENKSKDVYLGTVMPNLIKNEKTEVVREFSVAVQDAFAEYFKIDEIPVWYITDTILGVEEAKIKELVGDDK